MTADGALLPGFYGKLPVLGDFVTRRLPRHFVAAWDLWLQGAMSASREQLAERWLDLYLTCPLWRFCLGPGVCGEGAWAGILMPSVDRVGRYFPLTLAAPLADPDSLEHLFWTAEGCRWFERLEQLALSCLEADLDADALDESLKSIPPPKFAPAPPAGGGDRIGKFACQVGMKSLEQLSCAFLELNAGLLCRFVPVRSLWASAGSERLGASLLVCEGLPPVDAFAALLTGDWERHGWALRRLAIRAPSAPPADPPAAPDPDPGPAAAAPDFEEEPTTRPRPQAQAPALAWRSWGISVPGKKRKLNEDSMVERSGAGLWAVADGMGGHKAGDVASQAIMDGLAALEPPRSLEEYAENVRRSLESVNAELRRMAGRDAEEGEGQIIGSTVVVLLAADGRCLFLWAGDSRLYRFRGGSLEQMTRDHSLLHELDAQGLLGAGQTTGPGRCEIITRAVGADEILRLDQGECDAQPGDLFLLCSDGLDKELAGEEIEAVFRGKAREDVAAALVGQAEDRGARDNVTVVVVAADGPAAEPSP